jgi:membrane dipeptidase
VPIPPLRISAWAACNRILNTFDKVVAQGEGEVVRVETARAIRSAHSEGRLGALLAVEGGHVIGKRVERLARLRERGVRLLTLTHFIANRICDAHVGPRVHGGLSDFGREVVQACSELGIVVDLAHATEKAFYDVLETLDKPPVVTHTGLRNGRRSDRYLSDRQIKDLASAGGAVGVLMCPWYQKPWSIIGGLDRAVDVYARLAEMVEPKHLLLGTDMDGYVWLPKGMRDAADMPKLTAKLLERGFTEEDTAWILGGTALRVLEAWE